MRLLLDSTFPGDISSQNTTDTELVRLKEPLSDFDAVERAATEGYEGFALVGRDNLANAELIRAAQDAGLTLVVTSEDDPIVASRHLLDRLHQVVPILHEKGILLVTKGQVRREE